MTDTRMMGKRLEGWTPGTPPPELTLEDRIEQLSEIDGQIFEVAGEGMDLIAGGASVGQINAAADFLHTLFRRRDGILNEAQKAGYTEQEMYRRR